MKKSGFIALLLAVAIFILSIFAAGCSSTAKLEKPYGLTIDDNNSLSWVSVDEARSYVVSITDTDGATREETSRRAYFSLASLEVGDYDIKVKAIGNGKDFGNSVWSETYYFHRDFETGCLYKLINNNSEYEISRIGSASGEIVIEGSYRGKTVTSVGDGAFRGSKNVEKIVLCDNINRIGESAFYNCLALTEVVMADTINYIGKSAFQSCLALASVKLSKGLTDISESAFSYCRSLKEIDLTGVETIGPSAFSNCDQYLELVLPDSLTSLGEGAFSRATSLKSVTFNSGLEQIGDKAFAWCAELEELNFAQDGSLKEIGDFAFTECDSLTQVNFPEGLQSVGDRAFYAAKNLADVSIPASVTHVGEYVFHETKLYNDAISRGGKLVYADNWLVQIARSNDEYSDCPNLKMTGIIAETDGNNEIIPDNDTSVIFGYMVKFKPGVVGIADSVFSYCKELIYVEVPLSVKYIGNYSFYKCDKLYRINTLSGLKRIGAAAFANCVLLQQLYLGEGLETIGQSAFRKCEALVNPQNRNIIPQSVTQIEPDAFKDTGLWEKDDKYGVVYAGNWIVGYKGPEGIWSGPSNIEIKNPYYEQSGDDSSINIADYVFFNKQYYYYMLYTLYPELFEQYKENEKPQRPLTGIQTISGLENTKIIGKGAFYGCNQLTTAYVGDHVKIIRDYSFYGCESLTKVYIPYMLETVGTSAFYNCISLRNIVNAEAEAAFPGFEGLNLYGCRVTDIGDYAFYGTAIADVNFGDRVVNIGKVAFYNCENLKKVELPDTITEIKYATFAHCTSLESVKIGSNIKAIEDYAFYGCQVLAGLSVPDSVKSIGDYAFFDCGLETVDFGKGLEKIGAYSFAANNIQDLAFPDGIKSIGEYAFRDCNALQSVNVPESLQQVGLHAFYGCGNMTAYIQHESRPDGWAAMWNSAYRPEIWGCEMSEDGSYVVSVTVGEGNINNAFSIEAYQITVRAPYRAGYYFGGWTTKENSTEVEYGAGEITEAPAGTKLYAVWLQ